MPALDQDGRIANPDFVNEVRIWKIAGRKFQIWVYMMDGEECIGEYSNIEDAESAFEKVIKEVDEGKRTHRGRGDQEESNKHDEKTCDFCKGASSDLGHGGAHDFRLDGDELLYHDSELGWEGIKIKYCPMCGRRIAL